MSSCFIGQCFLIFIFLQFLVNGKPQSCKEIKIKNPAALDGEYEIWFSKNSTYLRIYCHNMTTNPSEYLVLPAGGESNFICKGKGVHPETYGPPCCGSFTKVRLIITNKLQIIRTDTTFMTSSDSNCFQLKEKGIHGYGSAGGCFGSTTGKFKIDLSGTPYSIPVDVVWIHKGWNPNIANYHKSIDRRIVSADCGGQCGVCNPTSGSTFLPLELTGSYFNFTKWYFCLEIEFFHRDSRKS